MARLAVLIALLGVAATTLALPTWNSSQILIIGGEDAKVGEFPWILDLRRAGSHSCGASLVNAHWAVTAAHCTQSSISVYQLVAGDHDISQDQGTEQRREVERIVNHPNYGSGSVSHEFDISLIKVSQPFDLNERVQPAALPPAGFAPTSDTVAAGWGATREGGPSSSTLLKVTVPYITDEDCRVAYGASRIADSMICAGVLGVGGKDACQGDSGGPLMCNTGSTNFLCGLVSWGIGCARPDYPGVYTEVSYFTDWVNSVINDF